MHAKNHTGDGDQVNGKMEYDDFGFAIGVDGVPIKTDFEHKVTRVEHKFKSKKRRCKVTFKVTATCNYHCDYCCNFPGEHNLRTNVEDMKKFIPYIKHIPHEKIFFYMFGGEPTLNRGLKELSMALVEECHRLGKDVRLLVQTNGHWKPEKYKEFFADIPRDYDITFSLSYHPTETDFKQIAMTTMTLKELERLDGINILMPDLSYLPRLKKEMADLKRFSRFDSMQIVPTFQTSWEAQQSPEFHATQKLEKEMRVTYIDENGEEKQKDMTVTDLIGQKILHYDGLMCGDGIVLLDTDGYVYKCWAAYGQQHRVFNYITSEDYEYDSQKFEKLISEPMLCKYKTCVCDLFNPKWKPDGEV